MTNKTTVILAVAIIGAGIGCGKKAGPPPPPTDMVQPQPYTEVSDEPPKNADDQFKQMQAAAIREDEIQSHAAMLTFMVQQFAENNNRVPTDLQELVTAELLPAVPTLPAGWKFKIDAPNKQVLAVRQ